MSALLEWVKTLLTFFSPIIVVWVTARSEHRRSDDAKVRKLEEEKKQKQDKELMDKIDGISDQVKAVENRVASLEGTIRDLQKFDTESTEDMKSLAQYYQLNSQYVHQVAQLVMVLAEGMRDKHLDGNITQAIASYHQFEQKTLSTLMSSSPIDD